MAGVVQNRQKWFTFFVVPLIRIKNIKERWKKKKKKKERKKNPGFFQAFFTTGKKC